MVWIIVAIAALIVLLWYALAGRAWLKRKPWAAGFFAWIEPIEISLFKKSETILVARLKMLLGVALFLLTEAGQIDLTPLMPLVPDKYQALVTAGFNLLPLVLTVVGWMDERLRKRTTAPIELVALPDQERERPEIAQAIAAADITKVQAVAAVAEFEEAKQ